MKIYDIFLEEDLNENGKLMSQHLFSNDLNYTINFDNSPAFSAHQYIEVIRLGMRIAQEGYTDINIKQIPLYGEKR